MPWCMHMSTYTGLSDPYCWAAGVIGNTPILRPYDCFEYYSAAFSKTKTGTMGGSFEMLNLDVHERFNALIEPFRLVAR